ncbi:PRA1 family protein B1-like [Rutidosis leptorrhynchoides]|uniref:PRA1 family protein B1-like n=1 Tax=Rutidosis leptorrhynchoides TaxID=125765 RepID=UPI003A99A906
MAPMKQKPRTAGPSRLPQTTPFTQRSQPPKTTVPNNPDLRPFLTHITTSIRHSYSQRRPWFQLVDRSTFSRPETLSEAISRIKKNFSYFRINYTTLIAIVTIFSLLSHPFPLFFSICLLSAWLFLYLFRAPDQPVFLFDRTFSDRETLGILIISTILIVFLTGLVSLLISSVLFGLALTCVHAALRVPQEVFVDNHERVTSGLLSFLTETAATVAVASTPPTMPRV